MTCEEFVRAIDAYLDDQLSIMDILRMHGHLVSCEMCHRVMGSEAMLHALLTNDAAQDQPPESLRERILRRVVAEEVEGASRRFETRSRPGAFAAFSALFASALLVGLFFVVPWMPGNREREDLVPLAAEVAAKHLLYTSTQAPALEMRTSDASEMARWLGRRAGLSLKLPDLDRTDGRLVGARVSSLADGPAVYLLYEWGGRHLSLFVTRPLLGANRGGAEEVVDDIALRTATLRGVVLAWWEEEDEGRLYAAAFTGDPSALRKFASLCIRTGQPAKPD
jgi:mycothiol system anti-sigma-R factor